MSNAFPHVLGEFYSTPWLISAAKFDEIEYALLRRIANGPSLGIEAEAARPSQREVRQVRGDVAVLSVNGTLTARPSIMSSGGTSCKEISVALAEMLDEQDVGAIVFDFNTPGGQVAGIEELGKQIAEGKGKKPIHASVNHLCCSAGMWLASQCTSISAAPNSTVGSVGVVIKHLSTAKAQELAGYNTTIVTAGSRKAMGDPSQPLSEDARKDFQKTCNDLYEKFVTAVATGRKKSKELVRSPEWGEGASLLAEDAKDVGMIDDILTLNEVVAKLRGKSNDDRQRRMKLSMAEASKKILCD